MDLVVLEDPARVSALFGAAHPQRLGELTRRQARRWMLGDAIGYVSLGCVSDATFHVELVVDAAHRRAGYGTRLLAHATAEATHAGARSMQLRPQATDEASIAFATKRGFTETMRMVHLVLDLRDARHDQLRDLMDRLAGQGIAVVTFADFAARSKDPQAAYTSLVAAASDLEMPDLREDPHAIVAEQRGRLVGFTSVFGTGVRRELRGCGVATAMKVAAIDAALARGETTLATTTGHPALRHIAEKLGYRERACELRMVRQL
jgi:GNAT superfamily N-acetyltransferase